MRPAARLAGLAVGAALLLAACGGAPQTSQSPPTDPDLESGWRLARFALRNDQPDQAVLLYERVLARAYARDDAAAIGNIGYEYALALLRAGQPEAAGAQARHIRDELERRQADVFAELFLVEAVAQYQIGDADSARDNAETAVRMAHADDRATRGRGLFILGMLAADAGNVASLDRTVAAMGAPKDDALVADLAELRGRRSMIVGDSAAARVEFETAATLRRDLRDYTGMARALASAGAAAEATGDPAAAADLYYRAGRSAAVQRDVPRARTWLGKALGLARDHDLPTVAAEARDRLDALDD